MSIEHIETPITMVFRRVVSLSANGIAQAQAGLISQGAWAELIAGEAELGDGATPVGAKKIASFNGGVVFDKKAAFNAATYPEKLTIISNGDFIFDASPDVCDTPGGFAEGDLLTVDGGLYKIAVAGDLVVATVELTVAQNVNPRLRLIKCIAA